MQLFRLAQSRQGIGRARSHQGGRSGALGAMLERADVFVQNLKPGAVDKLGFPIAELRREFPRLICCIDFRLRRDGPYATRKAYDLLIQAESGLASITGTTEPARVGVSVVDIATGMNAYQAILEALIGARSAPAKAPSFRSRCSTPWPTGWRCRCCSMKAGKPPQRIGSRPHLDRALRRVQKPRRRRHPHLRSRTIANGACWPKRCSAIAALAADPAFATNVERMKRRAETDGKVAAMFATLDAGQLMQKLAAADIAFARVNTPAELAHHPHLRRITVGTPSGPVSYPAPAGQCTRRRRAATVRCRRSASTPRKCGRNSCPNSSSWRGLSRPSRSVGAAFQRRHARHEPARGRA